MIVLGTATLLLAAADWLAFHDLFEHHTVTEYLMLVGSVLVVWQVSSELALKAAHRRTRE